MPETLPQSPLEPAPPGPAFSPLYRQIKALLVHSLQTGEWGPGDAIPSENELAQRFKVSQGTVRKAVDEMATENLLVRRQGKGTFVATHAEVNIQYRFLRLMPETGPTTGMARRVLSCLRVPAPETVALALGMPIGEASVRVRRTLSRNSKPVVLDEIWLPAKLFEGLTELRLAQYAGPMYGLFETEFGVRMIRAEEKVRAVAAELEAAALLEVDVGAPLLSVERLSFTYGDKAVELRRGLYQTADHYYRNELN
jgi:GntR family transcriptional regulator